LGTDFLACGFGFLEHGFDGLGTDLLACGFGFLEHGFDGLGTDLFLPKEDFGCIN